MARPPTIEQCVFHVERSQGFGVPILCRRVPVTLDCAQSRLTFWQSRHVRHLRPPPLRSFMALDLLTDGKALRHPSLKVSEQSAQIEAVQYALLRNAALP